MPPAMDNREWRQSTTSNGTTTTTSDSSIIDDAHQHATRSRMLSPSESIPERHGPVERHQSAEEVYEEALQYAGRPQQALHRTLNRGGAESFYPSLARIHAADVVFGFEEEKAEIEEEKHEIDVDDRPRAHSYTFASAAVAVATEEATVLDDDGYVPETDAILENEEDLVAMKRMAYGGVTSYDPWNPRTDYSRMGDVEQQPEPVPRANEPETDFYARTQSFWTSKAKRVLLAKSSSDLGILTIRREGMELARRKYLGAIDQEATVVSILESHPSELSPGAVQAEFIRQDFSQSDANDVSSVDSNDEAVATSTLVSGTEVEAAAEATVIDSAPLVRDGNEVHLWKYTREAQVLTEEDSLQSFSDSKPSAVEDFGRNNGDVDYAIAEQEAVVVDIEDDVHPSEFTDNHAEAELVGTDYSVGVAVPRLRRQHQNRDVHATTADAPTADAFAMVHEDRHHDPEEQTVQATLIHRDYASRPGNTASSEPSDSVARPFTNPFEDDPNDPPSLSRDALAQLDAVEDRTWMHAPSSFGDEDLPPAVALPSMSSDVPLAAATGKTVESEMVTDGDRPEWLREDAAAPSPPSPRPFGTSVQEGSIERDSSAGGTSVSIGSESMRNIQMLSNSIARGTTNVIEALFGESKPPFMNRRSPLSRDDAASTILPRILLPWSVIYSPANHMWVATLQTNQKALDSNNVSEASKSLRAFSLPSEKQAVSLAKAWTPPRMLPFADNPICHMCESRFAVFRRACHCRNCGVCVCRDCVTQWPSKMIPDTYNRKKETVVNVCQACDWLCNAFRLALLEGEFDKAVALHATANVNLNAPFANVKGELFYPVHCAALGGNLQLLRWLVDAHCCPIKSVRVSGKTKDSAGKYTPIVTSKGRSLLGIAMEKGNVSMIRYLVVKKGISLAGEKDITTSMLIQNLDAALRLLPDDSRPSRRQHDDFEFPLFREADAPVSEEFDDVVPVVPGGDGRTLSEEARDFGAIKSRSVDEDDGDQSDHKDECIICFDNKIDCVANPCGHQIMCTRCSENVSRCPVCAADCTFIRVYKP